MSLLMAWVYLRVNTTLCGARRVPVAIREHLRETLENLERREIIAGVTMPTPWISSMIVVAKKNGKLHICLDQMDLNCALPRENYPMPTIEESFPSSQS